MRLVLDREICTGHGRCYSVVPELFEDDPEGFGVVKDVAISSENEALARQGEMVCPERAIELRR